MKMELTEGDSLEGSAHTPCIILIFSFKDEKKKIERNLTPGRGLGCL